VSDESKVDHLILWTVPGTGTYCKNISRLGCGQRLRIAEADDQAYTSRFDRIEDEMQERAISDHVHNVDTAMEAVLAPLRSTPNVVNLFSGGVDSTLIQTYLGNSVPAVYVKRAGATNSFEAEYATSCAQIQDTHSSKFHRRIGLAHSCDYFCGDGSNQFRHLVMAHGKSLVIPFLARPAVSSAMQVPVSRRYIKRLQSKYLLKSLLHKRLPKYPAY
jgi:asparagine synthetase B (glutamine-hydrolysing)